MNVFEFDDYKLLIQQGIKDLNQKGPLKKMAEHLQIHGSLLSQILRGGRHLSQEQAFLVTTFFKLSENEAEYFMYLVAYQRAGTEELKEFYRQQLAKTRVTASQKSGPLPETLVVNEKHRAEFYSNWFYSGIRLLTAIEKYQDTEAIEKYFGLPKTLVNQVLKFLIETGLCTKSGNKIKIGSRFTALEVDSPFLSRHHMNWRVKGLDKVNRRTSEDYFLTYPMALGVQDIPAVKAILMNAVSEIERLMEPSPCEKTMCLNIDWFNF